MPISAKIKALLKSKNVDEKRGHIIFCFTAIK